VKQAYKLGT